MGFTPETMELLLLVACVGCMAARRFRVPYTVVLVLLGLLLALTARPLDVRLTRELIFNVFLPPLIFEAAFQMPWPELRRDLPVLLALATVGVLISVACAAAGMHYAAGWEWSSALLLGILLSATDPVSVIATFKEARVGGRLRLLVEVESLFNDGTVAVLFAVAQAVGAGQSASPWAVAGGFAMITLGGMVLGLAVGAMVLALAGRTDDHLIELTFTSVAAYGSFLLAEHFHFSGVLATLAAGILLGNTGPLGAITDRGRVAVAAFWEYVGFVVNSFIFLLVGMRLAHQRWGDLWLAAGLAVVFVTLGRAVGVYGVSLLFARSRWRVAPAHQHLLVWGGLRGALALALVLGLPRELPARHELITVTFAAVAFSIIVQGLTMKPALARLGELPGGDGDRSS